MSKPQICFFFLLLICACGSKQEQEPIRTNSNQDSLVLLPLTIIADLRDSLQPKTILLKDMPKPLTIVVPDKVGGVATFKNEVGDIEKINLTPPSVKLLPVLKDDKEKPILDKVGNPFILGEGGIADFIHYTTDDGLALDGIVCSMMDKSGHLWFGTGSGGVSKYNGKSFINFTTAHGLAGTAIFSMLEDKKGHLWFGTRNSGVSKYDGHSFTNFTTAQGLGGNAIFNMLEDKKGHLWFNTDGRELTKYDGKSFVSFPTAQGLARNHVLSMLEDKKGHLWFGTSSDGILKYDGQSFSNFTIANGLADSTVNCLLEDKDGHLWFGTERGGVSRYDGESFTNFTTANGLAANRISGILEDKAGHLWFNTDGSGLTKYDGRSFISFTSTQGLAGNKISSMLEDRTGNLWFSTRGSGVSKYSGASFTSFTTNQGLGNNGIWSMLEDKKGQLWFGTNGSGVLKYDGKSYTSFTTNQGLADNVVLSILEDKKGQLWFGTNDGGISKYNGKSFISFTSNQGLTDDIVLTILEDKKGHLWFGTYGGGISKYDGQSFTNFTTEQGLANNIVSSILEDKFGHLWFGTYGGGVSKYDGNSFTNFTTDQGLADNVVSCIFEDKKGNLWFGTDTGLNLLTAIDLAEKITKNKEGMKQKNSVPSSIFKTFTTTEGLPDNFITQIIQLPNDKMAIGTNVGITLFQPSEDLTTLTNIEVYNSSTGYPIKDVNAGQNCMLLDSKGIIWAGTGSDKTALVRFDYGALPKNNLAPTPMIQHLKVNEEVVSWYNLNDQLISKDSLTIPANITEEVSIFGKKLSLQKRNNMRQRFGKITFDNLTAFNSLPVNLSLPYTHNNLTFDFIGVETSRNFMMRYQYLLEGYSKEWSPITDKTSAVFGNINEGNYTFKLKARSPEGIWSKPIAYTFNVRPPWYRTWWAYLIYSLLFLLALRIFSKWRERKLRAENEKLEEVVAIRTAEVVAEKKEADRQRERSDELLLNILPAEVAEELKMKGSTEAKQFEEVTVMFTDFKDFTQLSERLTPSQLVAEIHYCFKAFDNIITKYNVEKIKTIGDAYMCVGGLPVANTTNASDVVAAAIEIQQFMQTRLQFQKSEGKELFEMRIGIHTGPVVAGIVGVKKFAYDIWGNTVNIASRMESSGEVGKINISGRTYELVKDEFQCLHRGKIQAKHKGEIDMYFVASMESK